ncbi:MAG: hypothetical protein FWH27_07325 [Planctomycetaceae bacterium]|nr:hypothetical protein [Planctomycetaceae bacterium]
MLRSIPALIFRLVVLAKNYRFTTSWNASSSCFVIGPEDSLLVERQFGFTRHRQIRLFIAGAKNRFTWHLTPSFPCPERVFE